LNGLELPELFNPLNAELNPICHFLALLGALHILHVSGVGVKYSKIVPFYKEIDKIDLVNTEAYQFANYVQNFIQNPAFNMNLKC
jgi:hypothetical protein